MQSDDKAVRHFMRTEEREAKNSKPALNGSNEVLEEDSPIHDWYRFVLSFPPHLVRHYLDRLRADSKSLVLDPFCGTGTTLVECRKQGFPSVGIEANPMAHFASKVKSDWSVDVEMLRTRSDDIEQELLRELGEQGLEDNPALFMMPDDSIDLMTLPEEQLRLLVKNSISPVPLHKALLLRKKIRKHSPDGIRDHQLLALASATVQDSSNLKFGPEVGVGAIKPDAPVVGPWRRRVRSMERDITHLGPLGPNTAATVIDGDARVIHELMEPESIDIVITSPPYPNEKDYSRTTRLESVLLGFMMSNTELRTIKKGFLRSNTRGVYKDDDDHKWIADFPTVAELSNEIERRRIDMGKTSGFERAYHRVTKLYFGGMAKHLANLREVLKPRARLAYVVGDQASYLQVMIRTGKVLAEIAQYLGYQVQDVDLFRTRFATATGEELNEEVLLLSWPG